MEVLKKVGSSHSESMLYRPELNEEKSRNALEKRIILIRFLSVMDALSGICNPSHFYVYEFPPPNMA